MEFVSILGAPQVDIEEAGAVIAKLRLSEDDHGWRLIIEWPSKPKATKIVRL